MDIFITASHIPDSLDVQTDQESRKPELRTKLKLHGSVFGYIQKYLEFFPSVGLFAPRINAELSRLFSYRPDPKAEVINSFCVSWDDF